MVTALALLGPTPDVFTTVSTDLLCCKVQFVSSLVTRLFWDLSGRVPPVFRRPGLPMRLFCLRMFPRQNVRDDPVGCVVLPLPAKRVLPLFIRHGFWLMGTLAF